MATKTPQERILEHCSRIGSDAVARLLRKWALRPEIGMEPASDVTVAATGDLWVNGWLKNQKTHAFADWLDARRRGRQ